MTYNANVLATTHFEKLVSTGEVDFGLRSKDYATLRPGCPDRFFRDLTLLLHNNVPEFNWNGKKVLDVGSGPGTVGLVFAKMGAKVIGVDISKGQIKEANEQAKLLGFFPQDGPSKAGVTSALEEKADATGGSAQFFVGSAEQTGQASGSFDVIVAAQCWHWFKPAEAMMEMHRLLKPKSGFLVIVNYCYLPLHSTLAKETEDLVLKYNPTWKFAGIDGFFPAHIDLLTVKGGFALLQQSSFDYNQPFTHETWRGRIRTCNGVGSGSLSSDNVERFDADLSELLKLKYPVGSDGYTRVRHRVWCTVVTNGVQFIEDANSVGSDSKSAKL